MKWGDESEVLISVLYKVEIKVTGNIIVGNTKYATVSKKSSTKNKLKAPKGEKRYISQNVKRKQPEEKVYAPLSDYVKMCIRKEREFQTN